MTSYSRDDWGSAYPRGGNTIGVAVSEIYIHHFNSNIPPERTVESAMARVRAGQRYHAETNGWGDIGYSWMVDDIGNDYEGRGWWRTGAHTYGYNSKGYAVCWLGDSNVATPSVAALEAAARVIQRGVAVGAVAPNPTIVAHRDRNNDTSCCGDPMYAQLDQIRALAGGGTIPTGEDDLTPEQAADLNSLVGPYKVDVYAYPDGRWLSVTAGAPAPTGTQLALRDVPPVLAWAVEGATASRVLSNQMNRIEAALKATPAGAGPSASAVAAEIIRQLRT